VRKKKGGLGLLLASDKGREGARVLHSCEPITEIAVEKTLTSHAVLCRRKRRDPYRLRKKKAGKGRKKRVLALLTTAAGKTRPPKRSQVEDSCYALEATE